MRLLVIDDEPLAQRALAALLSNRSDVEHFDTAVDAVDALEKLSENSYDVILLDINLPEISGTLRPTYPAWRSHPFHRFRDCPRQIRRYSVREARRRLCVEAIHQRANTPGSQPRVSSNRK